VKSHGGADEMGFYFALVQAYAEIHDHIIEHIAQHAKKI
jgi:fatty acid/phospholipid biosynthesis enzyme